MNSPDGLTSFFTNRDKPAGIAGLSKDGNENAEAVRDGGICVPCCIKVRSCFTYVV